MERRSGHDTTCIIVKADCDCMGTSTTNFTVQGVGIDYAHSFTATKDQCIDVKKGARLELTPSNPGMDPVPVEITTPDEVASCANPSGCRVVTFRCPAKVPTPFVASLSSCSDPDWYCADGYANDDPSFGMAWSEQQVTFPVGTMRLDVDLCVTGCECKEFQAGEYQSTCYYGYGEYEAKFQAATGSGVVTSFFVYTGEADGPRQDEIDIEILGRQDLCGTNQSALQTNYFVNGVQNPQIHCLPYDASAAARRYKFVWSATGIDWYIDTNNNDDLSDDQPLRSVTTGPLPSQPGKIMVNLWGASQMYGVVQWLGPFTYDPANKPVAIYHEIEHTPQ